MNFSRLTLWVITCRPDDYPNHYVLRPHFYIPQEQAILHQPYGYACLCGSLKEARESVPLSCVNLGREQEDIPAIVEVWLELAEVEAYEQSEQQSRQAREPQNER